MIKLIVFNLLLLEVVKARHVQQLNYGVIVPLSEEYSLRDVLKFPPFIEHIVQLVQRYFSNYIYEDLSRPPSWDSPNFGMEHPQFALNQNQTEQVEVIQDIQTI